jgi:hypothetical protein
VWTAPAHIMTRQQANGYNYLVKDRRDLPNNKFTNEQNLLIRKTHSTELYDLLAAMTRREKYTAHKNLAGDLDDEMGWRRMASKDRRFARPIYKKKPRST